MLNTVCFCLYLINVVLCLDYGREETDGNLLERGPKYVQQPVDFVYDTASVNPYVILECISDAQPLPTYDWMLERDQLMAVINPLVYRRYTIINGKLIIHNPHDTQDNGDYQCISKNKFGSILSNRVQLGFGCKLYVNLPTRVYGSYKCEQNHILFGFQVT